MSLLRSIRKDTQFRQIEGKYYNDSYAVRTSALFYNKDLLKEANMTEADIPTELEKFAEVAGSLAQWMAKKFW